MRGEPREVPMSGELSAVPLTPETGAAERRAAPPMCDEWWTGVRDSAARLVDGCV